MCTGAGGCRKSHRSIEPRTLSTENTVVAAGCACLLSSLRCWLARQRTLQPLTSHCRCATCVVHSGPACACSALQCQQHKLHPCILLLPMPYTRMDQQHHLLHSAGFHTAQTLASSHHSTDLLTSCDCCIVLLAAHLLDRRSWPTP